MQLDFKFPRAAAAVAVALAASLAVVACGGHSSAPPSAATQQSASLKFAQCMRSHGVPSYPDPGPSGSSSSGGGGSTATTPGEAEIGGQQVPTHVLDTAQSKCDKDLGPVYQAELGGRASNAQLAKQQALVLAYAKCMRAQGQTYPDPTVSRGPDGHGIVEGWPAAQKHFKVPYNSPAFKLANKKCSRAQSHERS